jgi:glycosyltransferase involved in cell wall biosynthesis
MEQPTITHPIVQTPRTTGSDNKIILVIPAYNDGATIGSVILKAKSHVLKIIVVDDGSTDRTSEVAHFAGAEVIRFQNTIGKGAACLEGLKCAHRMGCSIAILIDGDARYRTREIPWMISHILSGDADVVIGSRYLEVNEKSSYRQLIAQKIVHVPVRVPDNRIKIMKITDPLSGFIALNRVALEDLAFSYLSHDFKQKFLTHLISRELVIYEVAVTERPNIPKKTVWDDCVKTVAALPAYNEETHIARVIEDAQQYVDLVLVVDDGSTDATAAIARHMGALVIQHPTNLGYGAALRTIFSTARDMNLEALVTLDSDGQHDAREIEKVLEPLLDGADVVIGSRFVDGNGKNVPGYRRVGMKVLDGATRVAGVTEISDSQSGFRAYGKKAIEAINLTGSGMSAGSEILIRISEHDLRFAEVPIHVRYDIRETSTRNPVKHGVSVLYRLIGLISYRRPLPAFGIPGFICVILALIAGSWAFTEYYTTSKFSYLLSMGSAMFLILGLLLISVGLILNYLVTFVKEQKT